VARPFLNVDAGELEDEPEELYRAAELLSIACGGHAGDERSMRRALAACARFGTRAGAHPSYPDRDGFGRKPMAMTADALLASVESQCRALAAVARDVGVAIETVKPHGALYHAANGDDAIADAAVMGAARALGDGIAIVGPPSGALSRAAVRARLAYVREGFADRGVREDGSLVPRGEPGAIVGDPNVAAARARALAASGGVETICVHGDTPNSVAIARAVRAALSE
jgi:UPF0271 protein